MEIHDDIRRARADERDQDGVERTAWGTTLRFYAAISSTILPGLCGAPANI